MQSHKRTQRLVQHNILYENDSIIVLQIVFEQETAALATY